MNCEKKFTKKYTSRSSPPYPANECCYKTKKGNDGDMYESRSNKKGICSWKKVSSKSRSKRRSNKKSKSRSKRRSNKKSKSRSKRRSNKKSKSRSKRRSNKKSKSRSKRSNRKSKSRSKRSNRKSRGHSQKYPKSTDKVTTKVINLFKSEIRSQLLGSISRTEADSFIKKHDSTIITTANKFIKSHNIEYPVSVEGDWIREAIYDNSRLYNDINKIRGDN